MFRKVIIIILVLFFGLITVGGIMVYSWYKNGALQEFVVDTVTKRVGTSPAEQSVLREALGLREPRTYLFLLLNNTELRPGGGFIGAYAVVRMDQGSAEILKVEGTEVLDNYAPKDLVSVPPAPITKHLKVSKWYFRDSNWSPDFASSSEKSLELYIKEKGIAANEIDAVIGITPTVAEQLLKLIGPIVVDGEEFTSDTFTEKVEYEVEYGYAKKGVERKDRKQLLAAIAHVLGEKLRSTALQHWREYLVLAERMVAEKQVMVYLVNPEEQALAAERGWAGQMRESAGDYLLWVDANLGAWKTDVAMQRSLSYTFVPTSSGTYMARVAMTYRHDGTVNWRVRRYHTYTRLFVPQGSKLIKATGATTDAFNSKPGPVDQGVEAGRQWFGAFTTVEPGQTNTLVFEYEVSPAVVQEIKRGNYSLVVQKQLGTLNHALTLNLDFGTKIQSAHPGEPRENHGDTRYQLKSDLKVDREFIVRF